MERKMGTAIIEKTILSTFASLVGGGEAVWVADGIVLVKVDVGSVVVVPVMVGTLDSETRDVGGTTGTWKLYKDDGSTMADDNAPWTWVAWLVWSPSDCVKRHVDKVAKTIKYLLQWSMKRREATSGMWWAKLYFIKGVCYHNDVWDIVDISLMQKVLRIIILNVRWYHGIWCSYINVNTGSTSVMLVCCMCGRDMIERRKAFHPKW